MPDDAASFYEQLETLLDSGWEIRKNMTRCATCSDARSIKK